MTKTQIIYDETGYILSIQQGEPEPRQPVGVPFIVAEIPEGKRLKIVDGIGVDVSVTPAVPILEDIPPTEIELLRQEISQTNTSELEAIRLEIAQSNTELFEMMMSMGGTLNVS